MNCITGNNYDNILEKQLTLLFNSGIRNNKLGTTELFNCYTTLTSPRNRWCTSLYRRHNIFSTIAEVVWVLSGHDDMEFLSVYLPRAVDFSDDGEVWGGGYGPRLREYTGINRHNNKVLIDPLIKCVNRLHDNHDTRQAVINIWDNAKEHTEENSKDYCCNVALNFWIRDNKLNMTVFQRSQDIIWGSMVNYVEWTILQELLSSILEVDIGEYNHLVTNLHFYDGMHKRAESVLFGYMNQGKSVSGYPGKPFEVICPGESIYAKMGELDNLLMGLYNIGSFLYSTRKSISILEEFMTKYPVITTTLSVFLLHKSFKDHEIKEYLEDNLEKRKDMLHTDFLKAIELSR